MPSGLVREAKIFGHWLYFFAVFTLTIKYILPIGWALRQQTSWETFIYFWDAWWIIHFAVGYGLIHQKRGVWKWALALAIAEIVIIVTKFVLYLQNPNLDFWHLSWLVNKVCLLVYFCVLLAWCFRSGVRERY